MSLFAELKRRNVFRVALFYIVSAWVVIQVAETLLPVFDVPDAAIRIIVLILALGFPLALVFAWVFELTPEGLKRDKDIEVDPATKQQTAHKLNWATLIAAVLAIGLLIADRIMPESAPAPVPQATSAPESSPSIDKSAATPKEPDPASIAVLPFADLSPHGDQQYFSDGIAEEILNVLVNVEGLAVASRTSSFQFKSRDDIGIPTIAETLKVRHVLEGSLRKAGDTIRVTAQLIDASTDQHLWSQTWDRELSTDSVFAIQDEIAAAIVDSIRTNLGVDVGSAAAVPQRTANFDAYALFLEARGKYQARNDLTEADRRLERALELDPTFSDAWALRAAMAAVGPTHGYAPAGNPRDPLEQAVDFAERALALDPDSALAAAVLGLAEMLRAEQGDPRRSYAEMIADFDRALAADPDNLSALNWRGVALNGAGRFERARADFLRCATLEPIYSPCRVNLAMVMLQQGEGEAALRELLDAARQGGLNEGPSTLTTLATLGEREAFLMYAVGMRRLEGWQAFDELYEAFRTPDADHRPLAERLESFFENSGAGTLNEVPQLLTILGKHEYQPYSNVVWVPSFRAYRQSTFFKDAIRERGILDYWKETGFPDVCRPVVANDGQDDFECD